MTTEVTGEIVGDKGCFNAYLVDYIWKIIQVKFAFLIQQLNWRVSNELKARVRKSDEDFEKYKREKDKEIQKLKSEIDSYKQTIQDQ